MSSDKAEIEMRKIEAGLSILGFKRAFVADVRENFWFDQKKELWVCRRCKCLADESVITITARLGMYDLCGEEEEIQIPSLSCPQCGDDEEMETTICLTGNERWEGDTLEETLALDLFELF